MRIVGCLIVTALFVLDPAYTAAQSGVEASKPNKSTPDDVFLFQPARYPAGNWEPRDLNYTDVQIKVEDDVTVHGWHCPVDRPVAVVLYLHGNAGNLSDRARLLRFLQRKMKVTVFAIDYRGYGKSTGLPTKPGVIRDSEAALKYLAATANIPRSEVVVMGRSLGGAIALQVATKNRIRALVLESTFSSLSDVANVHFPRLAWLIDSRKFDSISAVRKFTGPVFISHGTADRVIPFQQGQTLYNAANVPKYFHRISGGRHNEVPPIEYYQRLHRFLAQLPATAGIRGNE